MCFGPPSSKWPWHGYFGAKTGPREGSRLGLSVRILRHGDSLRCAILDKNDENDENNDILPVICVARGIAHDTYLHRISVSGGGLIVLTELLSHRYHSI